MKKLMLLSLSFLLCVPAWSQDMPETNSEANTEINAAFNSVETESPQITAPQENSQTPAPPVQPPDALKALLNPQTKTWFDKFADEPYIALVNDYETTIKPDWSYEEVYHARIKIQKEEAEELGQWPVYYNKSRDAITSIQAYVETPDGRRYPAANVKDMAVYENSPMYSDMRMKVVTLPKLSIGSVIEVTVKSTTTAKEIPNEFWGEILYPAIPTQRTRHVFILPDDKSIQLKNYKNDYKPLVEESNGQTTYTFSFDETSPIPDTEELMPPLQEVLGAIYLSSMKDWKTVADWYRDLVHKNTVDDSEITLKAIELTKDKTTQRDKAKAIFEFLQDNVRYVPLNFGDNFIAPHSTVDVFRNHYGDSKDQVLLAKQMLKLAGIDSNVCLFSSEFAGNPQNGLPSPAVFSSVILQVSLDGHNYYVDPVLKGFDFGHYPANYDNAYVLVIDEAGYQFDNLPVGTEEDHMLVSRADVTVHDDGSAEYRVHVKLPIETSQSFKKSWGSSTEEDKDKFFANLEQNFAKDGKMVDRKVTGIEDRYGAVEFDLKYQAPKAYPLVNNMILIKEEDQSDVPEFVGEDRKNPIFVPNNSLIKNTNIYHIPEGFKLDSIPSSYTLSIDFMDVNVNYSQKDNAAVVDSSYRTKRSLIPVDHYSQVKDFRKKLSQKNEQYIVFKKSSEISPEAKDWVKGQ